MAKTAALRPVSRKVQSGSGSRNSSSRNASQRIVGSVLPARANRGNQGLPSGYIDSTEMVIDDSNDEYEEESKEDSEDSAEDNPLTILAKKAKKKGLSGAPVAAPELKPWLTPVEHKRTIQQPKGDNVDHVAQLSHNGPLLKPLQLVINVPPGHEGPILINVDLNSLSSQNVNPADGGQGVAKESIEKENGNHVNLAAPTVPTSLTLSRPLRSSTMQSVKSSFAILPPELRLRIYRLLFTTQDWTIIGNRQDFSRSAQLLRTCKLVYSEGTVVLYAENKFQLRREHHIRGQFFEKQWHEVGYEDCYRFLSMIQGTNISMLRDVGLYFDDALPSLSPDARRRRYVNDKNLLACLDLLGKHSHLQHIKLQVQGRRRLGWSFEDAPFLTVLKKIKVDRICFGRLDESDERSEEMAARLNPYTRGRNLERTIVPLLQMAMVHAETKPEEGSAPSIP